MKLSEDELKKIRNKILSWNKGEEVANQYNSNLLSKQIEKWQKFVTSDWDSEFEYEYNHDIGVRTWIQIAIETVNKDTSDTILEKINSADETFKSKMRKVSDPIYLSSLKTVLKLDRYFWIDNTIINTNN